VFTFQIEDMTCGHCASTITKAVGRVDPEANVEVDLPARLVGIRSGRASAETFAEAIREAGYAPVPVEAPPAG